MTAPLAASIADRLIDAAARGTWAVGARLPSIRALARDWQVSVGTVLAAYERLETHGILARAPRSGLYLARLPAAIPEPGLSRPAPGARAVAVEALAMEVHRSVQDPGLVPLAAAAPDADLLPTGLLANALRQALRQPASAWAGYAHPRGLPALRSAIARRALASGCDLHPDEIVITNGTLEAIALALRAICAPGDVVATESPIFFGIMQLIESLGLRVVEIPTHPRTGIQLAALQDAIDEHPVKAVIAITNFSNPLGGRLDDDGQRELVQLLAARGIPLIEDDIYGELAHDGGRPGVAKRYARDEGLLCSSFSKCLSPGLRVGWIAGGRHAERIATLKLTSSVATATVPQMAVVDVLANPAYDRHLRRLRAACGERCARRARQVIDAFPAGTRTTRPLGGFVLWIELPGNIDALALHRLAAEAGIAIAPGHLFSAKQRYRHFIRLNAMQDGPTVTAAVRTLGRLCAGLLP